MPTRVINKYCAKFRVEISVIASRIIRAEGPTDRRTADGQTTRKHNALFVLLLAEACLLVQCSADALSVHQMQQMLKGESDRETVTVYEGLTALQARDAV